AAEEHTRALQLAEALRLPLDRPAQENAVRLAGFEKELDPERPRLLLEPLVRESREGPGRDHGGDTRGAQSGGRPRERDEVSARRRRDRDDAGEALHVVGCRAVVPDDAGRPAPRYRAGGVASVRPQHRLAAAPDERLVDGPRRPRIACVIQDDELAAGVAGPELESHPQRPSLEGVAAAERDGRAEPTSSPGGR